MAGSARAPRRSASRLPVDERVDDIMAAARAAIAEKGYEKVLIADIAERAGVVEGTIYRYFTNKRDLLTKVAETWFGEQLAGDSHVEAIDGTLNKLRHLALRTLMVIRREPVLARFMLMELRPDPAYRKTQFFELNRRFTADVLHVCKAAIASGEFHDDVAPATLRDALFGCIEHRTWAFLRGEGDFSPERVADDIARLIYRGMVVQPAPTVGELDQLILRLERVSSALESKVPPLR